MPDLFLSYSREDQAVARRFAEGFEREGFSVWWDQALNPGEAFDQVTEEALAVAAAVVVLWSKASVRSRWVRAEATQANAANRLVPVMIEPCTRPIMFELTHTADLSGWKGGRDDPAWQALVASLRRQVQRRAADEGGALQGEPLPPPAPRERAAAALASVGRFLNSTAAGIATLLRRYGLQFALALAGVALGAALVWKLQPRPAPEVTRLSLEMRATQGAGRPDRPALASGEIVLSPDGRRIVYSATDGQNRYQLWSHRLDQDAPTPIPGSEGGVAPFFSPDGRSVAFFTVAFVMQNNPANLLKVFDFGSDAARVVADLGDNAAEPGGGGAWDSRGRLWFNRALPSGLWRVPAAGGEPESIALPDKEYPALTDPEVLPGGDWVLLTGRPSTNTAPGAGTTDILALNVVTGQRKVLLKGGYAARYVPTGHLVFARGSTVHAVAFDSSRVETRGSAIPVLQGVTNDGGAGYGGFFVAANGTLFYLPGTARGPNAASSMAARSVARVSHTGAVTPLSAEPRDYFFPRISPDGTKIAVAIPGPDDVAHIWIMDVKSGVATQLTFEGDDLYPVWTADSRDVLYTSRREETWSIWRKPADGTGEAQHLVDGSNTLVPTQVHGNTLVYHDWIEGNQRDIFTFDLAAGGPPRPLLATPADEHRARISPDGRWVVYASVPRRTDGTGNRIYARPYPDAVAGGVRAISDEGRSVIDPAWARAGDAIYYVTLGAAGAPPALWVTTVATTPTTITPTGHSRLFNILDAIRTRGAHTSGFDVGPDGEFIAEVAYGSGQAADAASEPVRARVVLNWFEELRRLVPVQ